MQRWYLEVMADIEMLRMALAGYQLERQKIQQKIDEIDRQLGGRTLSVVSADGHKASRQRRPLSAAAKRRIASAQKKRWAKYRAEQGGSKPKAAMKVVSAEVRRKRLAGLAKARAAKAAKKPAAKAA
ncbi:MAG TPA: hypothetical protein VKB88_12685 [Bryobacteraceae bacterium]|nr:hypothetical protein [Bryobacteraceae bacterium]